MTSLNQRINALEVYAGIETTALLISEVSGLQDELNGKQNVLTAGDNITILNNVISSTATGSGGATTIADVENLQTTLDLKQNQLTAGDNITIVNNVISSTATGSGSGSTSFVGFRAIWNNEGVYNIPVGRIILTNTNLPPYSYDTNNLYNTTTGSFYPDREGYWQMGFKFYNQGGEATTVQTNQLKLKRGGVDLGAIIFAGNNAGQSEDINTTLYLLVGDEIYLTHEGTVITFVLGRANNFFEARYVGS